MDEAPRREDLSEAEQHLYDLLLAPYLNASPFAISKACAFLEHPRRPPTPAKPRPENQSCICGGRPAEIPTTPPAAKARRR